MVLSTLPISSPLFSSCLEGTSYYPEDRQSEILRHGSNLLEEAKANLRDKVFFFGLKERFLDSVKLAMAQFGINKQIFVVRPASPKQPRTHNAHSSVRTRRRMDIPCLMSLC